MSIVEVKGDCIGLQRQAITAGWKNQEKLFQTDTETRRRGDTETRRNGDTETRRRGDTETRRRGDA
ncbi:MAG TPA: hypothetical protein VFH31_16865, partial [Pyrinomonadaceae bacterium]|nr:hypothetical protein [Pyrinomonadaceae bacterium]